MKFISLLGKIMSNLKEYRVKNNLSQNTVAQAAKITLRMYQYYEAGTKTPTVYVAIRIARALNTTVEELFPLEDDEVQ